MTRLLVLAALIGLVCTSVAQAHYGDRWFTTATYQAAAIDDYYAVEPGTVCRPLPPSMRRVYSAHSLIDKTGNRRWDHFLCGLSSTVTGRVCAVVAHSTGEAYQAFYLSSYYRSGCSPRDLRRLG